MTIYKLGHPAAFVYEALEHAGGRPTRSFDLVTVTGLSRAAVYEALQTLPGGTSPNPAAAGGCWSPAPACGCWPSSSAASTPSGPWSAGTAPTGPGTAGR